MSIVLLILGFVALSYGAAIPSPLDGRIVGGNEVDIALHPHQISLRWTELTVPKAAYRHICGGSVISANLVVTAAHCVIGSVASQFKVVAGANYRLGSDGAIVPVQQIIRHDDYNPNTYENDIALLVLSTSLPINNFTIKPIELNEVEPKEGVTSVVTGWGTTSFGGVATAKLHEVRVPIVSNEVCNEDYGGLIKDSMLCAGIREVGGKDACQGDSGGPLVVNGKLAGIVSWGYECAHYLGVYAKVNYLIDWLKEKIAEHQSD